MNTPGGNTNAAAELTISLLMALSRNLYTSISSLKGQKWERKSLASEVKEKTLGVIGLGAIGLEVAKKAQALGMKIVAFDPILSEAPEGM